MTLSCWYLYHCSARPCSIPQPHRHRPCSQHFPCYHLCSHRHRSWPRWSWGSAAGPDSGRRSWSQTETPDYSCSDHVSSWTLGFAMLIFLPFLRVSGESHLWISGLDLLLPRSLHPNLSRGFCYDSSFSIVSFVLFSKQPRCLDLERIWNLWL